MVPCISTDLIFLPMNTTLTFLSNNKLQIINFLYIVRNNVHMIKYYHVIIYTIIVISVYYHYNAINFIIYICDLIALFFCMFIKSYCCDFSKWLSILNIHVTEIHRMNSIPPVCFHDSTNLVYYIILLCYSPIVFYTEMTYWPTYMNSIVLCVHDECLQLVKIQNYFMISMSFITLQNFLFSRLYL